MAKYRKKPVIIEAFQYNGKENTFVPIWAAKKFSEGALYFENEHLYVDTLEGDMMASVGDYIIKGVNDEVYPCKPDIFDKTYELVED